MMRPAAIVASGAALILTACTVGPNYEPPVFEAPANWRTDIDDAAADADAVWWNAFEDPVLVSLVEEALRENRDVRVAASRVEEFAARVGIVRSAAFPQIDYDAAAGRSQISREIGAGKTPGADHVSDFFNANLNVGWEIDLWGRIRRASEAARADVLAAEENRRGVILTVVTAVANAYVGLRSLDEQLNIARRRLETRARTLELFELQFEKGVISQMEVAQVRTEYERTAATIPAIERDIALLENSLSVLLGRAPGPISRGRAISELTLPEIPAGLPSELLRRRPDLRRNEQQLVAANARIGEAIAGFYPRLALTGTLGRASDELANLADSSASLYEVAAGLAGPIFTAGRVQGGVDAAEAVQRQALDTYVQSILTAMRETEDALVTLTTTRREIDAQGRQVAALRVYAELADKRYGNGYVGYLEVLDAERDLFDAELQHTRLRASLYASVIGAYKAMGGGWISEAERIADDGAGE
ncbi:MAG: efflux transporter outer membrane subunit [Phycisphaerales bacterium]